MPDLKPATRPELDAGLDTDLIPLFLLRYEAANTRRSYANDLRRFFGAERVTLRMAQAVTFIEVNTYLEALAASGMRPAPRQRRVAALRGFFSWLMAMGLLEQNPADRHLIRRTQRTRRRDRVITYLTRDEARRLIGAVDPQSKAFLRDQTLMMVLLHCVLRRSEAHTMDFEHLRQVGEYWVLDLPNTKGGADQYVKVPGHIAHAIWSYRDHYGYDGGPAWRSISNNGKGRRLSAASIYNIVRIAAARAGLEGNVGAHTLRHTGCTLAIESGASLQQVQYHARHKSLETTMIYVHQRERLRDSAADYIDVARDQ